MNEFIIKRDFTNKPKFSADMLEELLLTLYNDHNEATRDDTDEEYFLLHSYKNVIQFVFNICEKFKLEDEVKFYSINLFERFLRKQLNYIMDYFEKRKHQDWKNTVESLEKKLKLRIISCIQIANKMSSNYFILSTENIQKLFNKMNFNYDSNAIRESEIKVLKVLDYRLNLPTPFQFLELLLEILGHNHQEINVGILYTISVKILECFCCSKKEVLMKLYEVYNAGKNDLNNMKKIIITLESDYLYLTSSIILAAAFICEAKQSSTYNLILKAIAHITKIEASDLDVYAQVLVKFMLG